MPKLLITGISGQLGRTFKDAFVLPPDWELIGTTREEFDLSVNKVLIDKLTVLQPDFIINTAAYTAVDNAETDRTTARHINESALSRIGQYASQHNIPIIHFSSDYVYHNEKNRPLLESDPVKPKGIYAMTKLNGERHLTALSTPHYVIRTSWVYAPFGHNFVLSMLKLAKDRDVLTIVDDQIGAPTYTYDIVSICQQIFDRHLQGDPIPSGIYNFSNEGVCSWYDFALAIFEMSEIEIDVKPIPTSEFPRPASRPHYSVMNKKKLKNALEIDIPHWRDALERCLLEIRQKEA